MEGKFCVDTRWCKKVLKFSDYYGYLSLQEQAEMLGISQIDLTRIYKFSRVGGYLDWSLVGVLPAIIRRINLAKIEDLQDEISLPDKQLQLL